MLLINNFDNKEDYLDWFENEMLPNSDISLIDLLHGYCQYPALLLSEVYGYKVALWVEYDNDIEKDALIHAFNVIETKDGRRYADIRGVLSNFKDVIYEFDYLEEPEPYILDKGGATLMLQQLGIPYDDDVILGAVRHFIEMNDSHFRMTE